MPTTQTARLGMGAPIPEQRRANDVAGVAIAWVPAELALRELRIRNECRRIAGPPRTEPIAYRRTRGGLHGGNHLQNRSAPADAEVRAQRIAATTKTIDGAHVRIR